MQYTDENLYLQVQMILGRYPANYKQAAIIPLLDLAQRQVPLPFYVMCPHIHIIDHTVASSYTL